MAKYLVKKRFLEPSGEWHHPGDVMEMDRTKAEVLQARGWIVTYQTAMMSPPETRGRRRANAIAEAGH